MKSNNLTMEDRLKKLYASLGLNVGAKSSNLAMIKSICAGFSIVEQNFDTVLMKYLPILRLISAGKKCANYLM